VSLNTEPGTLGCREFMQSALAAVAAGEGDAFAPPRGTTGARGSSDRSVCVLLVEDDPAPRRMIVNYFGEHNMRTLLASGHKDIVRHMSAGEVDLVILDLRLHASDGLDLLRELRSDSDIPVIADPALATQDSRKTRTRRVSFEPSAASAMSFRLPSSPIVSRKGLRAPCER
jgi:CheY-like chemotaxis protein